MNRSGTLSFTSGNYSERGRRRRSEPQKGCPGQGRSSSGPSRSAPAEPLGSKMSLILSKSRRPTSTGMGAFFTGQRVALLLLICAALVADAAPLRAAPPLRPASRTLLDSVATQDRQTGQSEITSPATGSSVSGSVPVLGTAARQDFVRYELYFKREPSGDEEYRWFCCDDGSQLNQVVNGQLGVWHTQSLAPGIYTLRMRVVNPKGNYGEYFARNISVNQQAPTPTPDEPKPTPIPIDTPTPLPQPTAPPVQVQQPDIEEPSSPTETPAAAAQSQDGGTSAQPAAGEDRQEATESSVVPPDLAEALSLASLRARFIAGVRWSAGLFLMLAAIFAAKRLLEWILSRT